MWGQGHQHFGIAKRLLRQAGAYHLPQCSRVEMRGEAHDGFQIRALRRSGFRILAPGLPRKMLKYHVGEFVLFQERSKATIIPQILPFAFASSISVLAGRFLFFVREVR